MTALETALRGSALVGAWTPAEQMRLAACIIDSLIAREVGPPEALWALLSAQADVRRAANRMERAERIAKMTDEQRRQMCATMADVEAEETT